MELAGTERGRRYLAEYLGEDCARGLSEFWEGEWIIE